MLELEKARWMKLIWNIPYNGMTVVMNCTTANLMSDPVMVELLYCIMLEVVHGANSVGRGRFSIPETYARDILEMTRHMTPYSPSMKLDFDYRRPLEIEYIYSRPVSESENAGYEMPRVVMLKSQLQFIQAQYLSGNK